MEGEKDFSVSECFVVGWRRFKEHAWFLIGMSLLMWVVAFVSAFLVETVYGHIEPTRSILDLLSSLVYYWLCFGMVLVTLKIVDGQPVTWGDMFVLDRRFVFYVLGIILYGFVVVLGLLALIIPGVYLALRYGFFWYGIIDGKKGVFDAFHESAEITRGVKWQLVLFALATIGVMLLGFFLLGVGVLVATPVTMLASAHLYRVLLSQSPKAVAVPLPPATPERPLVDEAIPSPDTVQQAAPEGIPSPSPASGSNQPTESK